MIKKNEEKIENEVFSSSDPSVKQRKIICLRRTTETTSKQALPPFNALFIEKQDREEGVEDLGDSKVECVVLAMKSIVYYL